MHEEFIKGGKEINEQTIEEFEEQYTPAGGGRRSIPQQQYEKNAKCKVLGNRKAYENNEFWLYPVIIVSEGIAKEAESLVNIVRQGILIKSNEKQIMWFIGGCEPNYWRSGTAKNTHPGSTT